MSTSPTVYRLQLGRELRRLREQSGVNREAAAAELECQTPKISKVETGKATLRPAEVKALLDLYGVTEQDDVLQLARNARRRASYRVPDWARTFIGMEAAAAEIRTYQTELVPGLLQTEAYARVVTQATDPARDPREVERVVAARIERQKRLHAEHPPLYWAILNEAVIRRQVGGPEIFGEQMRHLLERAAEPDITVQVLPFSSGAHQSMGSSFVHLRMADPPDAELIYLEDLISSDYLDRESHVSTYMAAFGMLARAALDPAASARLIEDAAIGE